MMNIDDDWVLVISVYMSMYNSRWGACELTDLVWAGGDIHLVVILMVLALDGAVTLYFVWRGIYVVLW